MEDLDNLVTRVQRPPVQRKLMTQSELEELVSREAFPKNPEKREKLKLYQMSKIELEQLLAKQQGLLRNKALVSSLPDKGEKIRVRIKEIEEQLAEHKVDDVESMTAILESLKIVEKRPTAAFFKRKELTKEPPKKEKFHAHRTKNYNEKAHENQPIKTLSIDQERAACQVTFNRIDEAEKARQIASLKSRQKIPVLLESEPKWRDQEPNDDDDYEDSDDEPIETGLEIQQNS